MDISIYDNKTADGTRLYKITDKNGASLTEKIYPSVTSVTYLYVKRGIEKWMKYQPKDRCEQIRQQTASRGTRLHKHVEDYLNSNKDYSILVFQHEEDKTNFDKLVCKLSNIDNIVMQETALCSDKLRVAGTVDCIGEYNGELAVIDFKTSTKKKTLAKCGHYFMQCAAYAQCYKEMTGVDIGKLVIIMSTEECAAAQIFIESTKDYLKKFCFLRREFFKRFAR